MREIVFSLNDKIATISLNKAQTKNSLNRNDLKQITEFLKKIKNMNLICLIIFLRNIEYLLHQCLNLI